MHESALSSKYFIPNSSAYYIDPSHVSDVRQLLLINFLCFVFLLFISCQTSSIGNFGLFFQAFTSTTRRILFSIKFSNKSSLYLSWFTYHNPDSHLIVTSGTVFGRQLEDLWIFEGYKNPSNSETHLNKWCMFCYRWNSDDIKSVVGTKSPSDSKKGCISAFYVNKCLVIDAWTSCQQQNKQLTFDMPQTLLVLDAFK